MISIKNIHKLAAGLLIVTGVLHLISILLVKFDAASFITLVFGVAYLVIGYFLLRDGRSIIWFGAIVPLVGLLLAFMGMLTKPTLLGVLFIAIDIIISAFCLTQLFSKEKK
jgi:hypothetical protein